MSQTTAAADIVGLSLYAIADLESAEGMACVAQYRQELPEAGLCIKSGRWARQICARAIEAPGLNLMVSGK